MKDEIIVKRYAEAYVSFALPRIAMPLVISDMKALRGYFRECPVLMEFLRAPEIPRHEKDALLDRVLGNVLTVETLTFIKYLLSKRREDALLSITDYIRVVYSHGAVVDAVLRSTYPLEIESLQLIKDKLAKRIGKNVNLYLQLDPDLLGGIQIVIGNRVIDGTVRNKLNDLKKQMLKAQVVR